MPEQLALDQVLGNGGAIHLHEPLAAAQTVAVDRPRDELLADAALALNQHRRVGGRRAADRRHDVLEPGAVADHLMPDFDRLLERPVLVAQLPLVEGVAQRDEHLFGRERLLDEIERPFFRRFDGGTDCAVAGDDHHRKSFVHRPETVEHLEAVHARHLHVEQHEVRRFAFREREAFLAGGRADEIVAFVLEHHAQRVANGDFVIDDQDA